MKSKLINWPLVITAYVTMFCLGTLDNIRGPFFPDVQHSLGLSNFQAAFFYAVVSGLAFVSGSGVANSAKRFGQLTVLRVGQLTMAIGFAALSQVHSFWQMIAACIVFGFGFGILNVAQNLLVLDGSSGPIRRRLLSGLHAMYAFSSILAPLLAAHFFHVGGTWRQGFLVSSAIVLISFLISFWPKQASRRENQRVQAPVKLHRGRLWMAASMISFYTLAELTVSTRLALYLRNGFGYLPEVAAQEVAKFYFFLLVGRLIFLFFHFRWSTRSIIGWSLAGTVVFFGMGLLWRPDMLALCGLSMSAVFGLSVEYIAQLFPEAPDRAVNNAIAISCLFIVMMHIILGVLTDQFGVVHAFMVAPGFAVLSLVFLWLSARKEAAQSVAIPLSPVPDN